MKCLLYTNIKEPSVKLLEAIREYLDTFGYEDSEIEFVNAEDLPNGLTFESAITDYVVMFTTENDFLGKTKKELEYENIILIEQSNEYVYFEEFSNEKFKIFDEMISLLESYKKKIKEPSGLRKLGETIKNLKDFKDVEN